MTGLRELINLRKEIEELNNTPLEDQEIVIEAPEISRSSSKFFDINQ